MQCNKCKNIWSQNLIEDEKGEIDFEQIECPKCKEKNDITIYIEHREGV